MINFIDLIYILYIHIYILKSLKRKNILVRKFYSKGFKSKRKKSLSKLTFNEILNYMKPMIIYDSNKKYKNAHSTQYLFSPKNSTYLNLILLPISMRGALFSIEESQNYSEDITHTIFDGEGR